MQSTSSQNEAIANFLSVTGETDREVAIELLTKHSWNLQRAVLERTDPQLERTPLTQATANINTPTATPRHHGDNDYNLPQHSFLSLLLFPISFGAKLGLSILLGLFKILSRWLSRPRIEPGSFVQTWKYPVKPDFSSVSYARSLEQAQRNLRYLLVYLHSPDHDDTDAFCINTLGHAEFLGLLREKSISIWGADVRTKEGYQVSQVMGACAYPFLALVAPKSGTRLSVLYRFQGIQPTKVVLETLERLLGQYDAQLGSARVERQERESSRSIRQMQDEAYEASLKADRLKAQKLEEERGRVEREAHELKEAREAKISRRAHLAATLRDEPPVTKGITTTLSIRSSGGQRLIRRFLKSDTVQMVYDFVECSDIVPIERNFTLVCTFPRQVLDDKSALIESVGLFPNGNLVIEENE